MKKDRREIQFAWLTLVGMAGYLWCNSCHVCIDGHLYHKDMPEWWLYSDLIWAAAFVAAAVTAFRSGLPRKSLLAGLLLALIISRLVFFSFGGGLMIFEVPAEIILVFHATRIIWKSFRKPK